jgi:hypothetical protein
MSELLRIDNTKKAREYLKLAGDTLDSDKRLIIRIRQYKKLKRTF